MNYLLDSLMIFNLKVLFIIRNLMIELQKKKNYAAFVIVISNEFRLKFVIRIVSFNVIDVFILFIENPYGDSKL